MYLSCDACLNRISLLALDIYFAICCRCLECSACLKNGSYIIWSAFKNATEGVKVVQYRLVGCCHILEHVKQLL